MKNAEIVGAIFLASMFAKPGINFDTEYLSFNIKLTMAIINLDHTQYSLFCKHEIALMSMINYFLELLLIL